jgi:hypothetical protein
MLNRLLLYTALLLFPLVALQSTSQAQTRESDRDDQIKSQKIAFFTEKLSLTPEEAQKFWPVYNDYWKRKNKIIEDRKVLMKQCSDNLDKFTAVEVEKYADQYINSHKLESDLLDEFNQKFKKVLPVEKVMKLYFADHEFKTYLLQQIRNSAKKEE